MRLLWSGDRVDIKVVTCSMQRKTGGEIKEYKQVRINIREELKNKPKYLDDTAIAIENKALPLYSPSQYINIILPNNELRKIYKVGIIQINDKTVYI